MTPLDARIAELEAELAALRANRARWLAAEYEAGATLRELAARDTLWREADLHNKTVASTAEALFKDLRTAAAMAAGPTIRRDIALTAIQAGHLKDIVPRDHSVDPLTALAHFVESGKWPEKPAAPADSIPAALTGGETVVKAAAKSAAKTRNRRG